METERMNRIQFNDTRATLNGRQQANRELSCYLVLIILALLALLTVA
jgi:hypothetical protein